MDTPAKKVFLVDDDQFLLNMYSLKFKNSGFEIETANSASIALQKLRDGLTPDVLLCDLVMPTMDGLEFLKSVKNDHLAPKAALIVLTNQSQSADIEKARGLGIDGYIVKASTIPSEVVAEVRKILEKHRTK